MKDKAFGGGTIRTATGCKMQQNKVQPKKAEKEGGPIWHFSTAQSPFYRPWS
jgi:hypothetical protein